MQSISVFLDIAKFSDFRRKMLMSAELKGCTIWFIYFWIFFVTMPSFIIVGYVWQILGFMAPHPWAAPKKPHPE